MPQDMDPNSIRELMIHPNRSRGGETLKKFVSYEYELNNKKDAGFIAQEVEESLPYAVHTKKDGYLALDTKPIIAHMHKAILEIDKRLSAIEEKLK